MSKVDHRFALIRDGKPWYAALVRDPTTKQFTFRIGSGMHRNAYDSESDLAAATLSVLQQGKVMRFAQEGGRLTTLSARSKGVTAYQLDEALAKEIAMPRTGAAGKT